ncbi:MAG: polysaccharide pyruvyl transferase family protein [Microcoleaceae cyanobacterium]
MTQYTEHHPQQTLALSEDYRISILGWYGNDNCGDEAILTVMLSSLRQSFPQAKYWVFSANPKKTSAMYQVSAIPKKLTKGFFQIVQTIQQSDLFIIGGGTLTADNPVAMLPIWFCMGVAILYRVPVFFYAQGVEKLETKLTRWITRFLVNRVSLITLRDSNSKENLLDIGVTQPQIVVTGDPGINLPSSPIHLASVLQEIKPPEEIEIFLNRPVIGICPKANIHTATRSAAEIELELSQLADELVMKLGVSILFVPMQNTGVDNDVLSSERIISKMQYSQSALTLARTISGNVSENISGNYSPAELKGILGQLDLVIGVRLHALIFAAAAYIPVIGIAYAEKIPYFLRAIGQEEWMLDLDQFFSKTLSEKVCSLWQQRHVVQNSLKLKVTHYQEKAATTIDYIEQILQN